MAVTAPSGKHGPEAYLAVCHSTWTFAARGTVVWFPATTCWPFLFSIPRHGLHHVCAAVLEQLPMWSCVCRRLLGIQMHGQAGMQHLISIHVTWPLLGRTLLQRGREGMLYFVFNSNVVAVLVAHNLETGEFVAQVGSMVGSGACCVRLWSATMHQQEQELVC